MNEGSHSFSVNAIFGPAIAEEEVGPSSWIRLDPIRREAMITLVRHVLAILASDVESWLPSHLYDHPEGKMLLQVAWDFAVVEPAVANHFAELSRQEAERIEDLRRTHAELSSD